MVEDAGGVFVYQSAAYDLDNFLRDAAARLFPPPVGDEGVGGRAHLETQDGASDLRDYGGAVAVAGFEHGRIVACADEAFRAVRARGCWRR
eukprot:6173247-Pleurochrysis_carterae.AAC.1